MPSRAGFAESHGTRGGVLVGISPGCDVVRDDRGPPATSSHHMMPCDDVTSVIFHCFVACREVTTYGTLVRDGIPAIGNDTD